MRLLFSRLNQLLVALAILSSGSTALAQEDASAKEASEAKQTAEEAKKQADQTEKASKKAEEQALKISKNMNAFDAMFLAEVYAILGFEERSLDYLEKAYDLRHPFMPWLELMPNLIQISENPRFISIVKKMNLPNTAK